MKKQLFVLAFIALNVLVLTGCAPMISGAMNASLNDKDVVTKTASYFGVQGNDINVTNISKGALETTYKVTYKNTLYDCSIYYGSVNCKKLEI
ncbi:MAG: hypothetical protein RBS24_07370 [Bacilli bacterium]|nr:hypothetical protein [Bacilli bacterium]